ncbi:conserved hypothetical protein [Actinacidiphila bryophytorum]|uniref:Uncharacterized protein n=1 Tax=Actinacidiphila bryophytorum TaxID=1436133 RepID=A0A9W4DZR6_9ACTN|nr:conserved hypothetical protein [Actinacidiphila bryophytorum]
MAVRARDRENTYPNPTTPARPASAAAPRRTRRTRRIDTPQSRAVQNHAIKNTTSNSNTENHAIAAEIAGTADSATRTNADRPQRAGAGVAEWG